jgi:2',3'-cyclic-nucleotide 2'-phosphodiesterase (5'-nucleotidase family)
MIVDAGNFTDYNMRETHDKTDCLLRCLGKMKYDVIGLNKQDLVNGVEYLQNEEKNNKIQFVCANLTQKNSKHSLFRPYVIKKEAGIKVGFFGLSDEAFWRDKALLDTSGLQIQPCREVYRDMVKKLRPKVHYLVLLTDLRNNVLDSLVQNNPGVDLILTTGSYNYTATRMPNSRTLLVGTGSRGQDATMMEIPFGAQQGDSLVYRQVQKPLTEDIKEDSNLVVLVNECKPKPAPAKIKPPEQQIPPRPGQTSLEGKSVEPVKKINNTPPTNETKEAPPPTNR